MPATTIRGVQILNGSVQRADMNTATSGQAVVTKIVQGSNITISSSGIDPGTGDVTVSGTTDPGTWTTPSFSTGWSDGGSCAYRINATGTIKTIFARGIASQVAGYQNESDSTQSLVLYGVTVSTAGAVNIYPIIKNNAVWTSSAQSQSVYLDGLTFSL